MSTWNMLERVRQRRWGGSRTTPKRYEAHLFRVDFVYDLWALRATMSYKLSTVSSLRPWSALMLSPWSRRTNYLCSRYTDKFSLCSSFRTASLAAQPKMAYGNIYNLVHSRFSHFVLFFTKRIILWRKHVWWIVNLLAAQRPEKNWTEKLKPNSKHLRINLTPSAMQWCTWEAGA